MHERGDMLLLLEQGVDWFLRRLFLLLVSLLLALVVKTAFEVLLDLLVYVIVQIGH